MYLLINDIKINAFVLDSAGERTKVNKSAQTVVILHGGLSDNLSTYYLTIVPELLRIGMNVIVYDRAGYGRSDYKPGCFSVDHAYRELDELLRLTGADEGAHIVGNSLGGGIAAGYAAARPGLCSSLLLLEGCPPTRDCKKNFVHYLRDMRDNIDAYMDHYRSTVGLSGRTVSRMRRMVMETTYLSDAESNDVPMPGDLQTIGMPTLGIYGANSDYGAHAKTVDIIGELPNVQIQVIPNATHFLVYEALPSLKTFLCEFYMGVCGLRMSQ